MTVLLDTSAINWLTDVPEGAARFFAQRDKGAFKSIVMPETADEIRSTPDPVRRAALEETLSRFFPIGPTRVPRVGLARLGLARVALPADTDRLEALSFLKDGQDRNLAANAGGYKCDVFLTRDHEMSRRKRERVEVLLQGGRVLEPEAFLLELERSTNRLE